MQNTNIIDNLFGYYDKMIQPLPLGYQALISLALIVFLVWNLIALLKSGNWLLVAILILALPATWPAAKRVVELIWLVVKGLLFRAQN